MKYTVADRIMRYVQIDTEADPNSSSTPSSEKQKDLSRLLVNELQELGIANAHIDDNGYVYATIPSNQKHPTKTVFFCSHVDTAPDCSGKNVKPILHKNWDGHDIVLPDDNTQILSKNNHSYLIDKIGDDIITASGKTLLGADDKAGVAIIMNLAQLLMGNVEIPHGDVFILFTPDEEIGRGVDKLDLTKVKADFGYTLDGGECGHLEGENFSADACTITFNGVSAHPGYAKGKLVNSQKIAASFINQLPTHYLSPESTSGYEGFVHPVATNGGLEQTKIQFILRDFKTSELEKYHEVLNLLAQNTVKQFPGSSYVYEQKEQYRNMNDILKLHPHVMEIAEKAYKNAGLNPTITNIRGGTDGSRLSYMGLPCPNIFTGEMAIHSKLEYVSVQDMQKAVDVCIEIVKLVSAFK